MDTIKPKRMTVERRTEIIDRITRLYRTGLVFGGINEELCEIAIELLMHIAAIEQAADAPQEQE